MDPIPETRETVEEFGPFDDDLLARLVDSAAEVRRVVPSCVGMSVAAFPHDVVFTLVASDARIGVLDAVQYLTDGPCVSVVGGPHRGETRAFDHRELLDEDDWQLFARSTSSHGVNATLTLPVLEGERVVGSVNLYATEPSAFEGQHDRLAEIVGAWAPGAVRDADLDFSTLQAARETPQRQRDQVTVVRAASVFAGVMQVGVDEARDQIRQASARAGVREVDLATTILRTMATDHELDT